MPKLISCLLLTATTLLSCSTSKPLERCESKLVISGNDRISQYHFEEKLLELGHNSEPWETNKYSGKGVFWVNKNTFLKQDTLINNRAKSYFSKTDLRNDILLHLDYGDTELLPIMEDLYFEKLVNTARYSPNPVLQYFLKNEKELKSKRTAKHIIYSLQMGKYGVELFVNKANKVIDTINHLSYDELYGDVTTTFNYTSYITDSGSTYPSLIINEKVNSKITDQIKVVSDGVTYNINGLLTQPEDYQWKPNQKEIEPAIKITKYSDRIHFIDLEHTDDRVMVVEFEDYMLVAEAPLNSANGEIIITEAKKIAPLKPIKYFIFGHHHPHYLGGLRAFVHKEATILCTEMSREYVEYIANATHTLKPDSLHLEPKTIKTQIINDSLSLGEKNQMKIYFLGDKSAHTNDYLYYYFPNEKLIFQDDLCWIPAEGPIVKAGLRQIGLYNSIKNLGLEVETIIQSWPVKNLKVKTVISFAELEKSVLLAK